MSGAVAVTGLREFQRACANSDKELKDFLRTGLRALGEPVRKSAQALAGSEISHIGDHWSRMRLGVTAGGGVYVVPFSRGRGGSKRPNLANLLMDKAMQPALDQHTEEVVAGFELLLDRIEAKEWTGL